MQTTLPPRNFIQGLLLSDTLPHLLVVGRNAFHLSWRKKEEPGADHVAIRLYSGPPIFVSDETAHSYDANRFAIVRHVSGLRLPEGQKMILEMPRILMRLNGRDGREHTLCSGVAYLVGLPVEASPVQRHRLVSRARRTEHGSSASETNAGPTPQD